jgi:hypothetical protein
MQIKTVDLTFKDVKYQPKIKVKKLIIKLEIKTFFTNFDLKTVVIMILSAKNSKTQ